MQGGPYSAEPLANALLCGPSTRIGQFLGQSIPFLWSLADGTQKNNEAARKYGSREWADVVEKEIREIDDPSATIEMEIGKHSLSQLLVLRAGGPQKDLAPGQRRYELLAATNVSNNPPMINFPGQPPDLKLLEETSGSKKFGVHPSRQTVMVPHDYWQKLTWAFEAKPGQTNEWTIPVPDQLAQAVRKALKADREPTAKPAEKADSAQGNG
jgi:hypothetical protein